MRLLVDTCTFLWVVGVESRLSDRAADSVTDPANTVFLSAVSAWEIAVKHSLGRLEIHDPPSEFVPAQRDAHGLEALPLDEAAALYVATLPSLHRDPFDRMLVCQAVVGELVIVTPDDSIRRYAVRTLW